MVLGSSPQLASVFGLVPAAVATGEVLAMLGFITSQFMHADFWHILFNMYFLYIFGREIEARMPSWKYASLYLFGGVIAGGIHILFNLTSGVPAIGASGAISMLMGIYAVWFSDKIITAYFFGLFPATMSIRVYMGIWFAVQIIGSLGAAYAIFGGVAWMAHVGGFLAGLLFGKLMLTRK
jgi:membrane associated rhomboid family serine protease